MATGASNDREAQREQARLARLEACHQQKKEGQIQQPLFGIPVKIVREDSTTQQIKNVLGDYDFVQQTLHSREAKNLIGVQSMPATPVATKPPSNLFPPPQQVQQLAGKNGVRLRDEERRDVKENGTKFGGTKCSHHPSGWQGGGDSRSHHQEDRKSSSQSKEPVTDNSSATKHHVSSSSNNHHRERDGKHHRKRPRSTSDSSSKSPKRTQRSSQSETAVANAFTSPTLSSKNRKHGRSATGTQEKSRAPREESGKPAEDPTVQKADVPLVNGTVRNKAHLKLIMPNVDKPKDPHPKIEDVLQEMIVQPPLTGLATPRKEESSHFCFPGSRPPEEALANIRRNSTVLSRKGSISTTERRRRLSTAPGNVEDDLVLSESDNEGDEQVKVKVRAATVGHKDSANLVRSDSSSDSDSESSSEESGSESSDGEEEKVPKPGPENNKAKEEEEEAPAVPLPQQAQGGWSLLNFIKKDKPEKAPADPLEEKLEFLRDNNVNSIEKDIGADTLLTSDLDPVDSEMVTAHMDRSNEALFEELDQMVDRVARRSKEFERADLKFNDDIFDDEGEDETDSHAVKEEKILPASAKIVHGSPKHTPSQNGVQLSSSPNRTGNVSKMEPPKIVIKTDPASPLDVKMDFLSPIVKNDLLSPLPAETPVYKSKIHFPSATTVDEKSKEALKLKLKFDSVSSDKPKHGRTGDQQAVTGKSVQSELKSPVESTDSEDASEKSKGGKTGKKLKGARRMTVDLVRIDDDVKDSGNVQKNGAPTKESSKTSDSKSQKEKTPKSSNNGTSKGERKSRKKIKSKELLDTDDSSESEEDMIVDIEGDLSPQKMNGEFKKKTKDVVTKLNGDNGLACVIPESKTLLPPMLLSPLPCSKDPAGTNKGSRADDKSATHVLVRLNLSLLEQLRKKREEAKQKEKEKAEMKMKQEKENKERAKEKRRQEKEKNRERKNKEKRAKEKSVTEKSVSTMPLKQEIMMNLFPDERTNGSKGSPEGKESPLGSMEMLPAPPMSPLERLTVPTKDETSRDRTETYAMPSSGKVSSPLKGGNGENIHKSPNRTESPSEIVPNVPVSVKVEENSSDQKVVPELSEISEKTSCTGIKSERIQATDVANDVQRMGRFITQLRRNNQKQTLRSMTWILKKVKMKQNLNLKKTVILRTKGLRMLILYPKL
ncbi:AF4/FMR2 family member 4 isoform X3 [Lingula anatina]|uniref:AF4/FMR2 family member 4 isoform X3 n=1 Tax=Lingula anatina TaxID=7574 RepID=A0A1S3J1E2_LINAN|nr:AF4/FMR2 family member 4 isoform X3 [Lingula anatina]|eukprot:XP_013403624.1 AF4/FMR2 family member 4 isoform X3 [Lingula anatina]